jgi:hypothetical protein
MFPVSILLLFFCSSLLFAPVRKHIVAMSGPGVGFEYPATEVSWLKRDVLLFANTIGATTDELHFLYVRWAIRARFAASSMR